jgi:tRNA A37 threonylcarbamoyladenosine modification protein TsaB
VLVLSLSNPLQLGIYENNNLIEVIKKDGKSSEILPEIFKKVFNKYTVKELLYVNSPGSYMAIKVIYIFLKTISIAKNIPMFATDGFYFNNNNPIKALGKKYFIKKNNQIVVEFVKELNDIEFNLPKSLDMSIFHTDIEPTYNLPAIDGHFNK